MSSFAIGDVVEVVKTYTFHGWLGRRLVVIGFVENCTTAEFPHPHVRIRTAPNPVSLPYVHDSWHHSQLRKINPPDWSAPLVEQEPQDLVHQE